MIYSSFVFAPSAPSKPVDVVAEAYVRWYDSMPFDCGTTCGRAFAFGEGSAKMLASAAAHNATSEANGALMRCAPLACAAWVNGLSRDAAAAMARQDARLSHPSSVCQDANSVFCAALVHLLDHPGDADGAVRAAESAVVEVGSVASWLELSREMATVAALCGYDCRTNVGHVKHAFVLAFALFHVLRLGGDTDTNACICGYMMGALHGFRAGIPAYMRDPVLGFDCTAVRYTSSNLLGNARPAEYRSANVFAFARAFCDFRQATRHIPRS